MRVHVVAPYNSHAMAKMAEPVFHMPAWITTTTSDTPDWAADINYFIPWFTMKSHCGGAPPPSRCIALYTHMNPGMNQLLRWTADHCDRVIAMSRQGAREVRGTGTATPVETIYPGVLDTAAVRFSPRKRNILVVGREQPNGRKNSGILVNLAWTYDLGADHFTIIGKNWEPVVTQLKNLHVSVEYIDADISDLELAGHYRVADALLVTGFKEGGPLTLIEALATGIPVITPGYGLAADLARSADLYLYDDPTGLHAQLDRLVQPAHERVLAVRHFTLQHAIDDHTRLFQELFKIPVKSRYDHVIQAARDLAARSTADLHLMEIGVHWGNTAEAMIAAAAATGKTVHYHGYDLFRELTDEEMARERSKQPASIDEVRARLTRTGAYINLYPGDTRHTLTAPYSGGPMDLIFLDGGHSWSTIESDWNNLQRYIGPLTVVLLDDYYTDAPGEIGCQRLVDSLDGETWVKDVLSPTETWGDLKINMVRVQRRVALGHPHQLQLV